MTAIARPRRIGFLVPSSNTVFEDVCFARLPRDGSIAPHFARLSVTHISDDERSLTQFDADAFADGFDRLAEARPDLLVWAGTAASWLGFDVDARLRDRISARTGLPVTTSLLEINARLAALEARRIALVTPYEAAIESRIIRNYESAGYEIAAAERLDLTVNTDYAEVAPETLMSMARRVAATGVDAVAIICTNLAGAAIVERAEIECGAPVIDSLLETLRAAQTPVA